MTEATGFGYRVLNEDDHEEIICDYCYMYGDENNGDTKRLTIFDLESRKIDELVCNRCGGDLDWDDDDIF
jgi:hypothetical protein